MTMLILDSFQQYGTSEGAIAPAVNAGLAAMAQAPWWGAVPADACTLGAPAWGARTGTVSFSPGTNVTGAGQARIVLPSAQATVSVGFGYSVNNLPTSSGATLIVFSDASNNPVADVQILTTGGLTFATYPSGVRTVQATASPVITAANWLAIEMLCDLSGGAGSSNFTLNVAGTAVITATGLTYASTAGTQTTLAQFSFGSNSAFGYGFQNWIADLFVYNASGTYNNTFPLGDVRVAYLPVNNDVTDTWTPHPRAIAASVAILDNTFLTGSSNSSISSAAAVLLAPTTKFDVGTGDFTLESFIRFANLPTSGNTACLLGMWDTTNSKECYQLAYDGTNIIFRVTTDGSTVINAVEYSYALETDTWYHFAVVRATGEDLLFLNGAQLGLPQTDSNDYYSGASTCFAIGCQIEGTSTSSPSVVVNTAFDGWFAQTRLTVGYARYISNFSPPTSPLPVGASDPHWSDVQLLLQYSGLAYGWGPTVADLSQNAFHVYPASSSNRSPPCTWTVDDESADYQTMSLLAGGTGPYSSYTFPRDDTFIEAALVQATGILTLTGQPADGDTVTVGTKDGTTAAVYTFNTSLGGAFSVLIGASASTALANLVSAINATAGAGTTYGTGTTANYDVTAAQTVMGLQMVVTAIVAGTAGNSIASTKVSSVCSWGATTLAGGTDIPNAGQFGVSNPPPQTTVVLAAQILSRQYKTDSGTNKTQMTFITATGGSATGKENVITLSPAYYGDMFEEDPYTSGALSPTSIIGANIKVNRTE